MSPRPPRHRVALGVAGVLAALLAVSVVSGATASVALGATTSAAPPPASTTPSSVSAVPLQLSVAPSSSASGATTESAVTGALKPNASTPALTAVYPNPVASGDAGEFVVVSFPERTTLSEWSVSDGETTASLSKTTASPSNRTVAGTVAFSTAPDRTRNLTELQVRPLPDSFSLSNGGERVALRRAETGHVVDSITYPDATEGERWLADSGTWRPLGATDRPAVRTDARTARAFVLPDAPGVPVGTLRAADDRILLAGYSFSSRRVARELAAAERRGVRVRVLVDDGPVGGISQREARVLDWLVERDVRVEVIGGQRARYDFHHAKYAVADDRALVLTENWKPAGVGGHGSRGWGVVVRGNDTAAELAEVFEADAGWKDSSAWRTFREGKSFEPASPANATYPTEFEPANVSVHSVTVLTAPDNAESGVLSLLRSANESIRVEQMTAGGPRQSFVRETLAAARRGVEVRVLLSSAWYVREDNRRVVEWLNRKAERGGLPLQAKLVEPNGFEKIHAKGLVVDGEHVVVGSLNWNDHSARQNREVAVVLHSEEAGAYYERVFRADWRGGRSRTGFPLGLGVAVALGVAFAVWFARREATFVGEE